MRHVVRKHWNHRLLGFATCVALAAACDTGTEPDQQPGRQNAPVSLEASAAAITHTLLTAGNNTANQKVYTTASISPAPNALITVAVLAHRATIGVDPPIGAPPSPTVSGGGMTAWTVVTTTTFDGLASTPVKRLTIYRAMSAAPGSGPLTITFSNNVSNCQWIVSQWTGVVTSGVNGAGAIGQTGSIRADGVSSLTVPLAAFGNANNVAFGVFGVSSGAAAITPGAGFTEVGEQPSGESAAGDLEAEGKTNDNTVDATWTNLNGGALGVEIIAAATSGPNPGPGPGPNPVTVTHTLLTAGNNTANQKVYTTASISPAANALITVAVLAHRATDGVDPPIGAPPSPTLSGGGMTAWTQVATTTFDGLASTPVKRLTIYRAMSAAPGSGPLTITFSNNVSNCQWIVSRWAGVETSGVNGAGAIGQTGSTRADGASGLTVPLTAFGNANNVAYGVFGVSSSALAVTPGAGFTEVGEQPSGESAAGDLEAEGKTNDNTIDATWTNLNGGALGVEIRAAGAAPAPPPPPPPGGARITGVGAIRSGPAAGAETDQTFDFDVTDAPAGRLRFVDVGQGASFTVDPADSRTGITSFTRSSTGCVTFGGTGLVSDGMLRSFVIEGCDIGSPGVGRDIFTIRVASIPYLRSGILTDGDITISGGGAPAPTPGNPVTCVPSAGRTTCAIGTAETGPTPRDWQEFTFSATNVGGPSGHMDISDFHVIRASGQVSFMVVDRARDRSTGITFLNRTSATCVRFGGTGRLDTNELMWFFVDVCDNGSPTSDTFRVELPDRGGPGAAFIESGALKRGDIVISGTTA